MKYRLLYIYVMILFIAYVAVSFEKASKIDQYLDKKTKDFLILYETNYDEFRQSANLIYDTLINKDPVINIFKELKKSPDKITKDMLRKELFLLLKEDYRYLKSIRVKQLHFHLPNNESFIRFHKISKYGDNLTGIRETVMYTNKHSKRIDGFEEGRVYSGYRFLYPIINKETKEHLGSVEVSFDATAFSASFMEHFKVIANFHIKEDIVLDKVWSDERKISYAPSRFPGYYVEIRSREEINNFIEKYHLPMNLRCSDEIVSHLEKFIVGNRAKSLYDDNIDQIITTVPVSNPITKEVVAFFSIKSSSQYIKNKEKNAMAIFLIIGFLLTIIFYYIYKEIINQEIMNDVLEQNISQKDEIISKYVNYSRSDLKGNIIDASEKFIRLTGYEKDEIIGKSHNILRDAEIDKDVFKDLWKTIQEGKTWSGELRNINKDGTINWFKTNISPEYVDGECVGYIAIRNNITLQKKMMNHQKELDLSNQYTNSILNAQTNFTIITDGLLLKKVNQVTLDFFGYADINEFHKEHDCICDFFLEEEGYLTKEKDGKNWVEILLENQTTVYKVAMYSLDGKKHIFQVNTSYKKLVDNSYVITFTDITDLNELQSSLEQKVKEKTDENIKQLALLQQQAKLAMMGEMIGAIAHQWRQPLNTLGINIQNLRYDFEDQVVNEKYVVEYINKNKDIIQFMSHTIDDFINFFKPNKVKEKFNVKESIAEVVSIISSQLKNNNILLSIEGDEVEAFGYKTEFQQVILNIIDNAKFELKKLEIEPKIININIKEHVITIEDNAGGIPQDIINRIFEPYYTTKDDNQGSGMGLYMSKMIIEDNMEGKLSVENTQKGAQFTIDLKGVDNDN